MNFFTLVKYIYCICTVLQRAQVTLKGKTADMSVFYRDTLRLSYRKVLPVLCHLQMFCSKIIPEITCSFFIMTEHLNWKLCFKYHHLSWLHES